MRDEKLVLGANDRAGLLKLNEIANKIVVDRLLEDGVNFYCTDGVVISPDAVVGRDTTIAPGTQLRGHVVIGEDCVIGPNTIIENSRIGDGCQIHSSLIEQSQVGSGVRIGPNSHLRPNSVLADRVKIGNFVEIKNSTLGQKTSVAHLTYIGDSDFGENINVGCGVVTVNYNGYRKFRSTVGDNAFIGATQTWFPRSMSGKTPTSRRAPPSPTTCRQATLPSPGPSGGKGRLGGRLPGKGACAQGKGKERKEVKVVSYSRRLRQGRTAV